MLCVVILNELLMVDVGGDVLVLKRRKKLR